MTFDRVAPVYDWLTTLVFGARLRRAAASTFDWLPADARRVLWLGGGTGQLLPALLARCPAAQVDFVEASAGMLRRAQRHLVAAVPAADSRRVQFHHGTEAALPTAPTYDAVVLHFVLDLFPAAQLRAFLARVAAATVPAARWLVADFAPSDRVAPRALQWVMYRFFRLTAGLRTTTLPDWPAALAAAGLRPAQPVAPAAGLLRAGCWQRPCAGAHERPSATFAPDDSPSASRVPRLLFVLGAARAAHP